MAKGLGVKRRIPPLQWRDALVRWGGWGGQAEASFTRFFSQRVYFIMLWGTVWRNMGMGFMIMLRHESILAGAVACLSFSQIRHFMPLLLLLPPLRMFDSSNCITWGFLSLLWRVISKSEVAFGFVAPIVILDRMQMTYVDIIFDVLYYPLTEPMKNMPLAFFILLFSIPIDANIGMHTGTQTDYLTATALNVLALLVHMLWAIHQRRGFVRQQTLMLVQEDEVAGSMADEHLPTSIHEGSTSASTTAITAGSVKDIEEEELPENESGSSDAEYDEPLRGLEHMMVDCMDGDMDNSLAIGCVPALTEEEAIERVLKEMYNFGVEYRCMPAAIPVTVYIPWSNPDDLGANAIKNVKSKLQELLLDFRVLSTTARKGSLILTFDLIYVGASPEVGQLEQIQSMVPTQSWVQWLDLPWPKDGEEIMVQVGDQLAVGVSWEFNTQRWVVGKAALVDATLHPVKITSVNPQVLRLPTSKEPIQLTIGVNTEVVKESLNPNSNLQLRARYMNRALPLDLHPPLDMTDLYTSCDTAYNSCNTEATVYSSRDSAHSRCNTADIDEAGSSCDIQYEDMTMLVTLHVDKILSAGEAFQPGLLILELWRHRTVAHSVPVLMVASKDQELIHEWSPKPGAPEQLGNSGLLHEQTIKSMGLWLEYLASLKAERLRRAPRLDPFHDVLRNCMLQRAVILLSNATFRGWLFTASKVLEGLLVDCGLRFQDVAVADTSERQSLLHAAVLSGKAYMVAAVIKWGDQNNLRWSWTVHNYRGITPLHMVACSGNTKLTASILKNFSRARDAWFTCKGGIGYTPAALASKVNQDSEQKPSS